MLQPLQQDMSWIVGGMVEAESVCRLTQGRHVWHRILPRQEVPANECKHLPHAG